MPSLMSQRHDQEGKGLYSLELAAREARELKQASNAATSSIDIPVTPAAPAIPLKRIEDVGNTREGSIAQSEATNGFRTYRESRSFFKLWPRGRSDSTTSDKEDRPSRMFYNLDSWLPTVLVTCGALLLILLSTLIAVHYCDLAESLEPSDEDHLSSGQADAAFSPED